MKNLVNKFVSKYGTAMASFAMMVVTLNVSRACMMVAHQPELPDSVKALRKF